VSQNHLQHNPEGMYKPSLNIFNKICLKVIAVPSKAKLIVMQ